ncbi:hypothetical protein CL634_05640 [bacterium]|nr:hypothetical protein [bacterium]
MEVKLSKAETTILIQLDQEKARLNQQIAEMVESTLEVRGLPPAKGCQLSADYKTLVVEDEVAKEEVTKE